MIDTFTNKVNWNEKLMFPVWLVSIGDASISLPLVELKIYMLQGILMRIVWF